MRHNLIALLLMALPATCLGAAAPEVDRPGSEAEPPTIQTTVIRPKPDARCEEAGCDSLDRLPPEQLERLRALDNQYPGQIIQFSPQPEAPRDQRR